MSVSVWVSMCGPEKGRFLVGALQALTPLDGRLRGCSSARSPAASAVYLVECKTSPGYPFVSCVLSAQLPPPGYLETPDG